MTSPDTKSRGPMPDPQDFTRAPELEVFAALDRLALPYANYQHQPTHTVAESRQVKADIAGGHTKSLFLKDKKNNLVLVAAWSDSILPLNQLHKQLGTQRLSFTNAELLWEALGVTPGSVSAFALLHDHDQKIRLVLDTALQTFDVVNFHPLRNDMTTSLARNDFLGWVSSLGRTPEWIDFTQLTSGVTEQ